MTMSKLFTSYFDEEMKSRGYKRKAKLYYRLNGDILQGVIIKTINPYTIHFYSAPYWMENIQARLFPFSKGYWAENGFCISPGTDAYYREDNDQMNSDYMNICFTIAKQHILPVFDKIKDVYSFIDYCLPNWETLGEQTSHERLIKIVPGDIDEKYSYIGSPVTMIWSLWDELYAYSAFLKYGCNKGDLRLGYDLLEEKSSRLPFFINRDRLAQNKYMEFMSDDGLARAEKYFFERRSIILPRLRDELGLDTFGL